MYHFIGLQRQGYEQNSLRKFQYSVILHKMTRLDLEDKTGSDVSNGDVSYSLFCPYKCKRNFDKYVGYDQWDLYLSEVVW